VDFAEGLAQGAFVVILLLRIPHHDRRPLRGDACA